MRDTREKRGYMYIKYLMGRDRERLRWTDKEIHIWMGHNGDRCSLLILLPNGVVKVAQSFHQIGPDVGMAGTMLQDLIRT